MNKVRSRRFFAKGVAALVALAAVSLLVMTTITTVFCDGYSSGLRFTSNGDGTCIVSRGSCTDTDIVIPERSPSNDVVVTIGAFGESYNSDDGNVYGEDYVIDDVFDMSGAGTQRIRIESVTIPSTVNTISASAFENCKNLTEIHYQGSPLGWAAITKGAGWNYGTGNYELTFSVNHNHVAVTDPAVAATCTSTGLTAGSHCSICGEAIVAQEIVPMIAHTEVTDPAVAATCTATGLTSGKHCSVCGTVILTQHTVPMIDHTEVTDPMVPATCTETGLTAGSHCSVCGTVIVAQEVIPAVGHNYIADVTAPTCTEGGYTTYTCDNCGDSYVANETSALGHAVVVDAAIAPTCTATGLTEGSHCSRCNTVLTVQTVVPATGHTEVIDAAVAATCTTTGLTQGKHCSVCNVVLIAQTVVPATGHTEVADPAVAPTCTETGLTAGSHCSVCGAVLTAQETVPAVGHSWDYGVITIEPTTTSVGEKTYTCSVCGDTYAVDVPKISEGWDGDVADGYAGGDGTEDHPYQIATASQWAYFAEQINSGNETNCYYELTADIIFNVGSAKNWSSGFSGEDVTDYIVGNACSVNPFVGHFNGNGYRISGFYANRGSDDTIGLFGSTAAGNEAYIENLVITNSYFEGSGAIGALLGQTSGGYTEISNIYVTDSVVIRTSGSHAGGIVGHNGNNGYGDPELYIFSCVNAADIVTTADSVQNVGGILGNGNGKSITIEDCLNLGDLTGYRFVAGIVGREDYSGAEINRCVNLGTVTATNTPSTYQKEITISNSSKKKPTLNDCMALTGDFGRYTDDNDCEVIDIEDFTSGRFANTKSMYNNHPDFYYNWTDFNYIEVCMPESLVDVIKGEIPHTKYYEGCAEHTWDDGVVEVEPTCEEGGLILYTCTVCGKTEEDELPAAGHTTGKLIKGYPATCTTTGRINYYYCSVCGSYLDDGYEKVASTTIPATGHIWDSGVITTAPTPTTPGEKRYTCTACGETMTETIYYEWDGVVAGGFAGGDGSETNPYEIATAGQWAYFAEYVRDYATSGEYFVLTADINFNSGDASDWDKNEPHNDMSDYQVGSWATPFVGTFDGQGYTISGFYATGYDENEVGIFGCTTNKSQATIRNLVVRNSYFATTGCTIGAVVGQVRGGTTLIENIFVAEDVLVVAGKYSSNDNSYAGGILGHVSANNDSSTNVTVNNCVNGASVTAQGRSVAGIVGNGNSQKVYINDCLNIGRIQGASYVCGILGYGQNANSTVTRCVNLGEIVGNSYTYQLTQSNSSGAKVTVTDCLALTDSYGGYITEVDCDTVTPEDFISDSFYLGELYGHWTKLASAEHHKGYYSIVNEICVPTGLYDNVSLDYPVTSYYSEFQQETVPNWLESACSSGTVNIGSVQQFVEFAQYINGYYYDAIRDFTGIAVYLTADLDFTDDYFVPVGGGKACDGAYWDFFFNGYFDGQGHTISGIDFSGNAEFGYNNIGIFGAIGPNAVICNFRIEDSSFFGMNNIAAVVGAAEAGAEVYGIVVADDVAVSGSKNVGGIVGVCVYEKTDYEDENYNKKSGEYYDEYEVVQIDACVNAATVTATSDNVGGILGYAGDDEVWINDCLNTGDITGDEYIAGIVGRADSAAAIAYCINAGKIDGLNATALIADIAAGHITSGNGISVQNCRYLDKVVCNSATGGSISASDNSFYLTLNGEDLGWSYWTTVEGAFPVPTLVSEFADKFELDLKARMLAGASVRLNAPTGIRFMARFSKDYVDENEDDIRRLGIIIAPEVYVSAAGEFTLEALEELRLSLGKTTYVKIDNSGAGFNFANASTAEADGYYRFNGVLGNMKENNYDVKFCAMAFIELNDGTLIYSDFEPAYTERRISDVAEAAYNDYVLLDTNAGITGYKNFVETVEVDGVTKYKYSPYNATKRSTLYYFFSHTTAEVIPGIFSTSKTPFEYTVGEDRYDIDCTAYRFDDTTKAEFDAFIVSMRNIGYTLHATNGENGINELCYQATLYNSRYTVNITYFSQTEETFITVEAFRAVSPLQKKPAEQYYSDNVYFHEPKHPNNSSGSYAFGEMDIFQLSNNRFVIVDGAQEYSSQMLVEYLENIVGPGNTPIIEAWFFTHAHPDHIYCAWGVGRDDDLVSRIKVNGFYYTWPNDNGVRTESDYEGLVEQIGNLNSVIDKFRTEDGKETPRYKIHAGMTFYINEVKVEVLLTQDQLMPSEYQNKFNDSSTSYKFTVYTTGGVESTFLIMGDAYTPVCEKLMGKYDYNTLHTTFFTSLHHGSNDVPTFFQFIRPDYIIYTAPSYNQKNKPGYSWLDSNCLGRFKAPTTIKLPY